MLTRDVVLFCHQRMTTKLAPFGYDVHKLVPDVEGVTYKAEFTSPDQGKRTIHLTLFEDWMRDTYENGTLSDSVIKNLNDAVRHLQR